MDDLNIQPYPSSKIQKIWMYNPRSMPKIVKMWIFGFLLDFYWIMD
jgi:hypothetical protein